MIKNLFPKALLLLSGLMLLSCEPDTDRLGEQFFPKTHFEERNYDIIGYNINNADTLRADNLELVYLMLGAFNENVFGGQKASFVSQARLEKYAPDFGKNPVVDSAVLVLKPIYDVSGIKESEDGDYVFPEGNINAKKKVTWYPVFKYGNTALPHDGFTINVHEVTDYLGTIATANFSDKVVGFNPTKIGTKKFKGNVNAVSITKDEDNSSLYAHDASLRIPLDKAFIQSKIIDKKGSAELSDAASFVRYFKGLRVSVEENDGYLMSLDHSSMNIIIYYKNDKIEDGNTTRIRNQFTLPMGAGNVRFGQYEYQRTGSAVAAALNAINPSSGDEKLYLQGMGGSSVGLRIPPMVIKELKKQFHEEKVAILGAKIRLYIDSSWENVYELPSQFVIYQKNKSQFLSEMTTFSSLKNFSLFTFHQDSPKYYDIVITETLKNIVEKEEANEDFILHVGDWRVKDQSGGLYGFQYDTRAYAPHRLVLTGAKAQSDKGAKLIIKYVKN